MGEEEREKNEEERRKKAWKNERQKLGDTSCIGTQAQNLRVGLK